MVLALVLLPAARRSWAATRPKARRRAHLLRGARITMLKVVAFVAIA